MRAMAKRYGWWVSLCLSAHSAGGATGLPAVFLLAGTILVCSYRASIGENQHKFSADTKPGQNPRSNTATCLLHEEKRRRKCGVSPASRGPDRAPSPPSFFPVPRGSRTRANVHENAEADKGCPWIESANSTPFLRLFSEPTGGEFRVAPAWELQPGRSDAGAPHSMVDRWRPCDKQVHRRCNTRAR